VVRRERPHPGAQLTFSDVDGYRFQTFATNTGVGQLAALEARHRARARVEDRIRTGKDTGYGRFPSRHFAINAVWLLVALTAADLLAWTATTLLPEGSELAAAEPTKLRYQLLYVAARIIHGQRNTYLRLQATWPWARELAAAFARPQHSQHHRHQPDHHRDDRPQERPGDRRPMRRPTPHAASQQPAGRAPTSMIHMSGQPRSATYRTPGLGVTAPEPRGGHRTARPGPSTSPGS
jgi:hypothetical protein